MKAYEVAALTFLALAALAAPLRTWGPYDIGSSPWAPLLILVAYAGLAAPLLVLAAAALLAPSVPRIWTRRRVMLLITLALLLLPIPALKQHVSDVASPENPGGVSPGEPSWMLLGVGLATGGRLGPIVSFEFDETILARGWTLAPLLWVGLAGALVLLSNRGP